MAREFADANSFLEYEGSHPSYHKAENQRAHRSLVFYLGRKDSEPGNVNAVRSSEFLLRETSGSWASSSLEFRYTKLGGPHHRAQLKSRTQMVLFFG